MSKKSNTSPDSKRMLWLLGGIYLLYLAWDMRAAIRDEGPLFLAAVILFAAVGLFIIVYTLRELVTHGYFGKAPKESTDESTESGNKSSESSEDCIEAAENCTESTDDSEDSTDQ